MSKEITPWNQQAISEALDAESVERVHHAFGRGMVHRIGQGENVADVDVYPREGRGVLRYTSAFTSFSVHDVGEPSCEARDGDERGSCIFGHTSECGHTAVVIYDTGEFLTAYSLPVERGEVAQTTPPAADLSPRPSEPVEGSGNASRSLTLAGEEETSPRFPEPVPASQQPDPWETDLPAGRQGPAGLARNGDDSRLGGEVVEQHTRPIACERGVDTRVASDSEVHAGSTPALATEPSNHGNEISLPSKEQQPRVKLTGNITTPPVLRRSPRGVPRVNFSVTEQETQEVCNVYSTKQNAEGINNQQLQAGELVRVNGVIHQRERRDTQGHPVTNEAGEVITENVIYAYGVRRLDRAVAE